MRLIRHARFTFWKIADEYPRFKIRGITPVAEPYPHRVQRKRTRYQLSNAYARL